MANNLDIFTITGINQVGNSYQRKNPIPLDYYSFFNTRADAEDYAKTGAVAYVGQVIAFKESATDATVKVCVIKNEAGDLEALNNVEVKIPGVKQGTYITVTTDAKGDYTIAHADAAAMTVTPETEKKTTFVTEITRDAQGHITGYKTATIEIPEVKLDKISIDKNADGEIEIKGFKAQTENGLIPQIKIEGEGEARKKTLEWVSVSEAIAGIEDKDTVTGVKAGNDGVAVTLQTPPDEGDDRTYVVSHKAKPTNKDEDYDVNNVAPYEEKGNSGTYVTDVIIDDFGHIAGVKKATHQDVHGKNVVGTFATSTQNEATYNEVYLNHIEDSTVVSSHKISGSYGVNVHSDENGNITVVPNLINVTHLSTENAPTADTVNVVCEIARDTDKHAGAYDITYNSVTVPTKAYVDKLVTSGVDYLGTISWFYEVDDITAPINAGDFVRVAQEFDFGENDKAHVGDILIATVDNPGKVMGNWDLIHTEIDANTWVANTKDADGYVTKGKDHENSFWGTDKNGVPQWIADTTLKKLSGSDEELAQAEGHLAVFNDKGEVVDGGAIAATGYAEMFFDEEGNPDGGFVEFSIEKNVDMLSKEVSILDYKMAVDGGLSLSVKDTPPEHTAASADSIVQLTTTLGLSDATKASLAKADTAVQPGDLPTVNDGKFTVSGTGYLTGSGEMTANQAGATTATLDLTQTTKDKIDNAMPKLPENERTDAAGHYAIFDIDGQVVDGGCLATYGKLHDDPEQGTAYPQSVGFVVTEGNYGDYVSGGEDPASGNPLIDFELQSEWDSGLTLTGSINTSDPASGDVEDNPATVVASIALSEATKASLAKADSAVQYVTLAECVEPKVDGCISADIDEDYFTTGFYLRCGNENNSFDTAQFRLNTAAQDGIVFSPNIVETGSGSEPYIGTQISLAPWAKDRILESVTEVATTANQGLKTTTTYTYFDETQDKEVTTTVAPTTVDYTKKTTVDIDENVTFILNCGTAADLL